MQYKEMPNGDLRFAASVSDREDLAQAYADGGYPKAEALVVDSVIGNGLEFVAPENIGALTNAPIFSDGFWHRDNGQPMLHKDAKVWWFPDYQVIDPWARLRDLGYVDFTLAPSSDA